MDISQLQIIKINEYLRGSVITQLVSTAVTLGLFDYLNKGAVKDKELAEFLKIDIHILNRYLRALEGLELITRNQQDNSYIKITRLGELLCKEGSAYGNAILSKDYYYSAWQELEYALKTGKSSFKHKHKKNLWKITDENPKVAEVFSKAMRSNSMPVVDELLQVYSFPTNGVIADLGAGDGTLLAGILKKYPALRGLAIEQNSMIPYLQSSLEEYGVTNRCEVICWDLLNPIQLNADIFILKSVLHNWDNKHVLQILNNCASNLNLSNRLLVLERAMDPQHPNKLGTAILDLTMLVLFGAHDRDKVEYRKLIEQVNLQIISEYTTKSGIYIIESAKN